MITRSLLVPGLLLASLLPAGAAIQPQNIIDVRPAVYYPAKDRGVELTDTAYYRRAYYRRRHHHRARTARRVAIGAAGGAAVGALIGHGKGAAIGALAGAGAGAVYDHHKRSRYHRH